MQLPQGIKTVPEPLTPAEERRLVLAERKATAKARDLDRQQKRQTKRGQYSG
mgnify:CR=1 FL=1